MRASKQVRITINLSESFRSSEEASGGGSVIRHRQGTFANLPMSRRGHRRYRPTSCPPSLRAAIRLGNACGPTRFRLCISAWRSPASARISRRGTCRRRGFGGGSPCSAARWRCSSRSWSNAAWGSRCRRASRRAFAHDLGAANSFIDSSESATSDVFASDASRDSCAWMALSILATLVCFCLGTLPNTLR